MHSELKELYSIQAALNETTILAITDTAGRIVFTNDKFCNISQYTSEELIGHTHKIINSNYHDSSFFRDMWNTISKGKKWTGEIRNRAKDGSIYWVDTAIIPFLDHDGSPYQYVSIRHDITDRKKLEQQLHKQLIEDKITGLPNAFYLENEVEKKILANEEFRLLLINMDDFKSFNESLGSHHANQILTLIGERLSSLIQCEKSILARTYNDEFALLCSVSDTNFQLIIKEVFHIFENPISYLYTDYYITFCIGAVHYPTHGNSYEDLMQNADSAVQTAKGNGKNTYTLFDESMNNNKNRVLLLKNLLHEAIQQKKFVMHYQPQYNFQGEIISFESLVRWNNPLLGDISPAEFIPVAERTGFIIPLGYLLFELVVQDLPNLQKAIGKDIKVAFNLSLKQFFDTKLISKLMHLCELYQVDPHYIKIEITEGVSSSKIPYVISIIKQFRDLGMEVELDDYGSGFSSLKHLKDFPINCIKIDQSFVKDLLTNASSKAIINSTIHLAHELGFTIIAEGIETEEQLHYLRDKGCDAFQGYLLGKPQPVSYYYQSN
ncbi:hypothetical protein AEA09_11075 [Lysinibacillus contaminans]|uniref:Diguanylate cyclase n=1 Tax=Lysinibacillus contaminans TaxID=1293441 RepID=A0ABR5K284_9BACI|nr:bifunctional diguanylate cyclase/phosphodiesterase [Lysinibacillus contaminans]KOS69033.1 hypothetical protein AEA09_11075 [Lysinibacillus contaminans]